MVFQPFSRYFFPSLYLSSICISLYSVFLFNIKLYNLSTIYIYFHLSICLSAIFVILPNQKVSHASIFVHLNPFNVFPSVSVYLSVCVWYIPVCLPRYRLVHLFIVRAAAVITHSAYGWLGGGEMQKGGAGANKKI